VIIYYLNPKKISFISVLNFEKSRENKVKNHNSLRVGVKGKERG